jgi:hypothetical protein
MEETDMCHPIPSPCVTHRQFANACPAHGLGRKQRQVLAEVADEIIPGLELVLLEVAQWK